MLVRRYEMPWRRAYEVYAGIAWWLTLLYFLGVGVVGKLPWQLALPLALVCFAMGVLRVTQACACWSCERRWAGAASRSSVPTTWLDGARIRP